MIAIETTSRCNNKCQMCPYRLGGDNPDIGDIDFETLKRIIDENPTNEICLFNRGEPFLYEKIYEAIEYASKKAKVIISTNGRILPDASRLPENLLVVFSVPAGNREDYKKITGVDAFMEVKKNIEEIQEKKHFEMYVKLVRQKENQGQEEELKKWVKVPVMVVDDSNQENTHGYTDCTQPDVCPTWDFNGNKKVCCRAGSDYDWDKYYNEAKQRKLEICRNCNIR